MKNVKAVKAALLTLTICDRCIEVHFGADSDLFTGDATNDWAAMETRLKGEVTVMMANGEPMETRTRANVACACCKRATRRHFVCEVKPNEPVKPAKPAKSAKPAKQLAKPSRVAWSERTFRVLSNPLATPKMHETLESAVAHAKRHVSEGRTPVVEGLVKGEWAEIEGWADLSIPASLPYRW